jgi:hypothetical protein
MKAEDESYKDDIEYVYVVAKEDAGKQIVFIFCQTIKSKDLKFDNKNPLIGDDHYTIILSSGEQIYNKDFYYSKSGKYLMYFGENSDFSFEERLSLIKTFCEMDD